MSDIQITINLPEDLVKRAQAAGLKIDSITPDVIAILEQRLTRRQAWQKLSTVAEKLQGSLTPEEIEVELASAKLERLTSTDAE